MNHTNEQKEVSFPAEPEVTDNTSIQAGKGKRKLLFGVGISVLLLGALITQIDWSEFFQHLSRVNPMILAGVVPGVLATMWIRALRWRYLIPQGENISAKDLYDATFLGMFANSVLPLRAGELLRPWFISRWASCSYPAAFASVVTERVFDILGLFVLLGLALGDMKEAPELVTIGAKGLGLVAALVFAAMLVSYFFSTAIYRLGCFVSKTIFHKRSPQLESWCNEFLREFLQGLSAIRGAPALLKVIALSIALWFVYALFYQCGLWAFGIHPESLKTGMMVTVMTAFAVALPSAPGFIGTFQVGCFVALATIYRYPKDLALAYAVVLHMMQFLTVIGFGAVILHRRGLHLKDLSRASAQSDAVPHTAQ